MDDAAPGQRRTDALTVEDVRVQFGGVVALDGVTIGLPRRSVVGLIGPNGAGKTTLVDVLSGLQAPTSGRILLDGTDITRRSGIWRARHGIRRTFQRQQVFSWLTIEENLLVAVDWHGGGGGFAGDLLSLPGRRRREETRRERCREVLELCGLGAVAGETAANLPIGLARLVEVARALVDDPALILLDEPTSGLNQVETERLGSVIRHIPRIGATTVVLIEHDVGFVMRTSDHLVVLDLGRVLATGTPDEIQRHEGVLAAYLGATQMAVNTPP